MVPFGFTLGLAKTDFKIDYTEGFSRISYDERYNWS